MRRDLLAAQRKGVLVELPESGWIPASETPLQVGRLVAGRRDKYLVRFPGTDTKDAEVELEDMADAVPGDQVLVEERRRARGRNPAFVRVVRVQERTRRSLRGRAHETPSGWVVSPKDREFDVEFWVGRLQGKVDIQEGDPVLVRLKLGSRGTQPNAEILVNLRDEGSLETDLDWIRAEFDLPGPHTPQVLAAADELDEVQEGQAWPDRVDLRGDFIFTIDPVDAKDFDDAVSIECLDDGKVRLSVHIADVSHYVRPESTLDKLGRERGTSVYLPSTVIPMLPERIANNLCSLRPNVDRLTKTVVMTFSADGDVEDVQVFRSVIHSKRRFTYEEILSLLVHLELTEPPEESDRVELPDGWEGFSDVITTMATLSKKLRQKRQDRGALNLNLPKLRIVFDKDSKVVDLGQETHDLAHGLIEEFMLASNEAVARHLSKSDYPIVARTHPGPDAEKLEEFRDLTEALGLSFRGGRKLQDFQNLIDEIADMPISPAVQLALLKTMGHAEYTHGCRLHFALATERYCHFTSPIRRYPDLLVHQILDDLFDEKLDAPRIAWWNARLSGDALQSSERERRAESAERAMLQLRLVRYLEPMLEQEFDAWVVSVFKFGFFVRLESLLVEGLVHVATLGDAYYAYDEEELALKATRGRRSFRMGDRVRVRLSGLDADDREISFAFVRKLTASEESEKK